MKLRVNPWFTDGATRFLNNIFKWLPHLVGKSENLCVLEWGGGNSTLWLLRKGCRVLTVESHQDFIKELMTLSGDLGFRVRCVATSAEALRDMDNYDCTILQAKSFDGVGEPLFAWRGWDVIINDGIDRLKVLEAITQYNGNPIVILDNAEYCANWGKLERCSAHPDRVKKYRQFLRNPDWKSAIFEQNEGRDGHAVADHTGWEAPHRWATAIAWRTNHLLSKLIVTSLGLPLLSPEGVDDEDVDTLSERCRFDWKKMEWIDKEFSKTFRFSRDYE